ncbi:MAG TPA: BamA/TamA family outer membrane protein, partial [Pirellulales bacterium]|nr:BamA/TamA family outer membrane protein [Pirellulales bacterium]
MHPAPARRTTNLRGAIRRGAAGAARLTLGGWLVFCGLLLDGLRFGGARMAQGDEWSVAPQQMLPATARKAAVGVLGAGASTGGVAGQSRDSDAPRADRRAGQPRPVAPLARTSVAKPRPQSTLAIVQSPARGFAAMVGQVPMGRTNPNAEGRRSWPRFQSADDANDGKVVPAQYAGPPNAAGPMGNYSQAPNDYGQAPGGLGQGGFGQASGGFGQVPGNNGGPVYAPPTQPPIGETPPGYGGNGTLPPPGGYDQEGNLFPPNPLLNDGEGPLPTVPMEVVVKEAQTGRVMFGVGVNSNAGLIGNVVLDEQNFDWKKVPRSWEDIRNATAFRGAGQHFRIEAMPGTQLSRYGFTFREPYLWDTKVNFNISASYFNRYFLDWTEQRAGGRVGFGYQLTPDLSANLSLGGEDVRIYNPIVPTPPELLAVLGQNPLYSAIFSLVHDTRDSTFLATEGHRVSLNLEQAWGKFSFPRAVIGFRKYFLIHERPDGSGRQVLTLTNDTGFTGSDTPIF